MDHRSEAGPHHSLRMDSKTKQLWTRTSSWQLKVLAAAKVNEGQGLIQAAKDPGV